MAARTPQTHPTFVNHSEREVFERVRDGLTHDCLVLASLRLTDQVKDHEIDLLVLIPGAGALVLEVKGGSVWHDESGWWIQRGSGPSRIHPVDQAREGKYALRDFIEADPRWGSRGRIAWAHGVVTPHADFGNEFAVPELPRWALHDKADQETLGERVRENAWGLAQGKPTPNEDDVELIAEILTGRHHTAYDVRAEAQERETVADQLTQEQATLLKVTRLLNRVEVRGGAGSGKTILALQQARELTRGHAGAARQRVALLCYSIGLAEWLKRRVAEWPRRHQPAFVGTFEEFGAQWGAPSGSRDDSDFWERRLPAAMAELAAELEPGQRYDAVIVDEAQDFADEWWIPLLAALRDPDSGGLFIYSDENQRIFGRFGTPPVALVPLVLDHNLRNTRQIHESFGPLAPSRMYARGGDGADVRFVAADSPADAVERADDLVDQLLDEGWEPGDLALLTTGSRHPEHIALTDRLGQVGYWREFLDGGDVLYGHVLGCKGLERRVVVLCLNEPSGRDRAAERLYVGMSRATDVLIVVGQPALVRAIGGDAVAKRLGL